MDLSNRVLGSYVATRLHERAAMVLLRIGRDTFTRADLADVACFNFFAAASLSAIVNTELSVKDTADLFNNVAPAALALPGIGAIAIAVLGAVFEIKGLGGNKPLEHWVKAHADVMVTFDTMKHHQIKRATERKHDGRDKAHRSNVRRFTSRQKRAS